METKTKEDGIYTTRKDIEKTLKKSQEDLIYLFSFFVVFLTYHVLSKIIPRYVLECTSRNDND